MNAKEFDALVNKGAVTHAGIVADVERLSADDFCVHHITQHEIAGELIEDKIDTADEIIATGSESGEVEPNVFKVREVEIPAEEPAKKSTKKSKNSVAPSVDPVE